MQQPHEVRRALGAHHHSPEILPVISDERTEKILVLGRLEIAETRAAAGRHQEVEIERNRAFLRGPFDELAELAAISLRRRRLNDEIEPVSAQTRQRVGRRLERAVAVSEIVVAPRVQRVDAHRDASDARVLERRDALVRQHRAVRADDDGGAAPRRQTPRSSSGHRAAAARRPTG